MQPPFLFRTPDPLVCHSSPLHPAVPISLPCSPVFMALILSSLSLPPPPLDPPPQWPEETSAQGFRQLLELNLLGTYTLTTVSSRLTVRLSDPLCFRAKCFLCLALILFQKDSISVEKKCMQIPTSGQSYLCCYIARSS